MFATLLLLVIASGSPMHQRETQWRVTFEIETESHIYRTWSNISDTGQTLREVAAWKHIEAMERRGYTLVAIERIDFVPSVPRVPTEQEHAIQDAIRSAENKMRCYPVLTLGIILDKMTRNRIDGVALRTI